MDCIHDSMTDRPGGRAMCSSETRGWQSSVKPGEGETFSEKPIGGETSLTKQEDVHMSARQSRACKKSMLSDQ